MSQENPSDLSGAIAVIGLAGRFPKAKNLAEFWQNLKNGREVVTFFSQEELLAAGLDPEMVKRPNYVPARAVLADAELFDAAFFGYSPREAQIIDPQQRVFLECAWEALESAGYDPDRYSGLIGVYGGVSLNSYLINNILSNQDTLAATGWYQVMTGNDKDFITTRTSYKLNLKGPSVNIQTACSTSLVAIHMASQSLLSYQCDMALAGGVSVQAERKGGYLYQPGMILSPDGHCRAFDHHAQGIVGGEGVGIVVLKRYADAVKDGDTLHAIIRGSAINNDGALKVGFTAPSVGGQTEVIQMAQAVGGVAPASISYVETHGTGTELGDPIEISALTQAFRTSTQEKGFCGIGSVKTNMGHLDAAAGVAGFIKTVLAMQHKMLPPSLHFQKPNPRIDFANSPFYVNNALKDWDTQRLPRRAGVSSFGIGGTNAHVVLEEPQPAPEGKVIHPEQLILLSARSEHALKAAGENLAQWLRQNPEESSGESLASAAYTLQVGRKVFKHRRILVCSTAAQAAAALEDPIVKPGMGGQQEAKDIPVAFLFPGQGAQYVNMGRNLYEHEPIFRQQVDRCAEQLKPSLGLDVRDILHPAPGNEKQAEELILQTWITQPALFTIEYSLAKLWMGWGVQPKAMAGHSIGEYVAACLAGVFTLEDGLALVAARGQMMQSLPGGSMLSVPLSEADVLPLLNDPLSLAVINAPKLCVISGPHEAIHDLQQKLSSRGIDCRKLRTSHAFHSILMEPILKPFAELARKVAFHEPQIPYLSNLTGTWITAGQATDPAYWTEHLRSTVQFAQNVEALFVNSPILLEVGPGQTLISLARQHPHQPAQQAMLASLRHPHEQTPDTAYITQTLGKLWLSGASPDWKAYHQEETLRRIPLPTYPFERKRYWLDTAKPDRQKADDQKTLSKRQDIASWFYVPSWQRSPWPAQKGNLDEKQNWLIFCDSLGIGQALARQIEAAGHAVTTVQAGDTFTQSGARAFTLNPDSQEQYTHLINSLSRMGSLPTRVVHLWTLTRGLYGSLEELQAAQSIGFYSLLWLVQRFNLSSNQHPLQMLVVSNHLHEVTGGETVCPAKATVLGACKVIPQENPNIFCQSLDIVPPDEIVFEDNRLIQHILAEFALPKPEPVVAYRGAHRWVQTYLPHPLPAVAPTQLPLKQKGVYLITGGYGGIGLALAGFLADAVQANLVLLGRTGLPERGTWQQWLDNHIPEDHTSQQIRAVQELENRGAHVLLLKADVSDPVQMKSAIEQIRWHFGALNGVIHAAGTPGGGILPLVSRDQAAGVFSAKVQGTWILEHLLENDSLDFFLLCSSTSAVVGGAGIDYSSANAFLDAFAAMKNACADDPLVRSINWGVWQEVGMSVNKQVPDHLRKWKEAYLQNGIRTTEGMEAFHRILASAEPQIIVSPVDFQAVIDLLMNKNAPAKEDLEKNLESTDPDQPGSQEKTDPRPKMQSTYAVPTNDIEKKMVEIWQDFIGITPIGIHDNFFELGGHSLMATQILSRIRDIYHIELSMRIFFEAYTIAELSRRIAAMRWAERNQNSADSPSSDREEMIL